MNRKSPFDTQGSGKVLPDRSLQGTRAVTSTRIPTLTHLSLQAMPHLNSNDRVIVACRRFRKVDVNTPLEGGDICMAVENCTTGSVPRKVISHLFGRNKVCTRRIPERVWVCMCRKHYQRIRYRTGADFSVTQIGMVYEQIVRMIFWSRGLESPSGTNQEGIAIRSWTFSIRRREVKRMADTNGRDLVPRWIMQSLGEGKTHDEILDIVERLHHEIQQGTLKDVPPVEFLPEVVDAFTNAPAQLQTQVSNRGEVSFASHPSRSLSTGEATESPSFVKESSPLEPVQEEVYMSERSSEKSTSSPTPPAVYDGSRPVYQSQPHIDYVPSRRTSYAFGSRSPFTDSGPGPDTDRRSSLAHYDSQNPIPPSISYHSINCQMQAPITDHRSSYDSLPHPQMAYGGNYRHHGPSEVILTDRAPSNHSVAMPVMVRDNLASYATGHLAHSGPDGHEFQASTIDTQPAPVPPPPHLLGSVPKQGQASAYTYREPTECHYQAGMNGTDTPSYSTIPDGRSYVDISRLQTHQPSWYPYEAGWNARIGRSVNQYQQHTLACAGEASLYSSRQYPEEETSECFNADRATSDGVSTVYPTMGCHSGYFNGYPSASGFDTDHAHGNLKAYQYNGSASEVVDNRHGARASSDNRQERGEVPI
ncbi:hypothetical protein FLONG3_9696 [Fusarium longipes]|uniref:Uncharacterized protein n=1 Tax=Fusarium longipes TaxID=694270 RepID=A0A395RVP0_9HYPO|nr:hypothetical protein FLONG3_9696 [Fusarium longipes]